MIKGQGGIGGCKQKLEACGELDIESGKSERDEETPGIRHA